MNIDKSNSATPVGTDKIVINRQGISEYTCTLDKLSDYVESNIPAPTPPAPFTLPYKSYVVTIGAGGFYLNKTEIYNSFTGVNFTCARINTGYYSITADSPVFTNKTCIFIQNSLNNFTWTASRYTDTICTVAASQTNWTGGTTAGNPDITQDTGSSPVLIEIRVYN